MTLKSTNQNTAVFLFYSCSWDIDYGITTWTVSYIALSLRTYIQDIFFFPIQMLVSHNLQPCLLSSTFLVAFTVVVVSHKRQKNIEKKRDREGKKEKKYILESSNLFFRAFDCPLPTLVLFINRENWTHLRIKYE